MVHMLSEKFPNYELGLHAVIYKSGRFIKPSYELPEGSSDTTRQFISRLLSVNSKSRPTATEALSDPYFTEKTQQLLKTLKVKPCEKYGQTIVNERDNETLLHYAARCGNVVVLQELLC